MKQQKIKIRPLSEGIGLGSLRSPGTNGRGGATVFADDPIVMFDPKIDTSVMRQAHAAYAPSSVAAELRARPSMRFFVALRRFAAGLGTDVFVGTFSVMVLAWSGILAWEAGSSGKMNPSDAFLTLEEFIGQMTWPMGLLAIVATAAGCRVFRMIFSRW